MDACKRCKKPVESFPINGHGKPSTMCVYCYEDTKKRNAKKFELTKAIQANPPEGTSICMVCKNPKPLAEFEPNPGRRRSIANESLASTCKGCRDRRANGRRVDRHAMPPEKYAKVLEGRRMWMRRWRDKVIAAYSGKCVCCGETEPKFLELDHIDGGGGKHRREIGANSEALYRWCEKNGFPQILQILCANCHNAKSFWGACPHQEVNVLHLVEA